MKNKKLESGLFVALIGVLLYFMVKTCAENNDNGSVLPDEPIKTESEQLG